MFILSEKKDKSLKNIKVDKKIPSQQSVGEQGQMSGWWGHSLQQQACMFFFATIKNIMKSLKAVVQL